MSPRGVLAIDSSYVYISNQVGASNYDFEFRMLNFASSGDVNVWANKIPCIASPNSGCTAYQSPSIIDSTGTITYNLVSYDGYMLFFGVSITNGAIIGSKFESNNLPEFSTDSKTIYQYSSSIFLLTYLGTKCAIITYDTGTNSFSNSMKTTFGTHFLYFAYRNGMLYFTGDWNSGSNTYIRLDVAPSSKLSLNTNIVSSTSTMVSMTTYQVNSATTTSLSKSTTSLTIISPTTITSDTVSIIDYYSTPTTSDVSYWLETVTSYNMAELTTSNISIDLTCSISGSTAITYSLVAYSTYTLPSWVTLDAVNSKLVVTTPDVSATTTYGLIVRSTISAITYDKIVLISVVNTPVVSTTTPSSTTTSSSTPNTSSSTSTTSPSGSSKSSAGLPLTKDEARATSTSLVSASILIGTVISVSSVYSPQKMWAILNQFQLYLLIGVLVPSLPENLLELILSMQDCIVSFNIFSKPSINGFNFKINLSNCGSSSDYYSNIGIPSSCSLIDNTQLITTYFTFMLFHLTILVILALSAKYK